jgi:hypothetical protein
MNVIAPKNPISIDKRRLCDFPVRSSSCFNGPSPPIPQSEWPGEPLRPGRASLGKETKYHVLIRCDMAPGAGRQTVTASSSRGHFCFARVLYSNSGITQLNSGITQFNFSTTHTFFSIAARGIVSGRPGDVGVPRDRAQRRRHRIGPPVVSEIPQHSASCGHAGICLF